MAADFGTGKTLIVLAIVLGCFAILWPKIFYPMMQTAFAMTSPNIDADGRMRSDSSDRPPHLHPTSAVPRSRGGSPADDVHDKFMMREGRPFPHPQARQPAKSQPKTGGAMSIIMPIYTVGIVVFFLYTVLKLVFKKPNEGDKKPLIKDFHMDPEYRKFVCQQPTAETSKPARVEKSHKKHSKPCEKIAEEVETKEMDSKDYEIYKLRKKLEETENAMERIMKNMGEVGDTVTEQVCSSDKKEPQSQGSDVRQRHKGRKQPIPVPLVRHIEELSEDSMATLEEDLSELISLCRTTDRATVTEEKSGGSSESEAEDSSDAEAQVNNNSEGEEPSESKPFCKTVKVA